MVKCERKGRMDGSCEGSKCEWYGNKENGMLSHISQMMVQRLNKQMKGEGDVDNIDILGNTTDSAIQATKQALYNLDHPLEYVPKSIEVQRACMKEREFYVAFLERLEKL